MIRCGLILPEEKLHFPGELSLVALQAMIETQLIVKEQRVEVDSVAKLPHIVLPGKALVCHEERQDMDLFHLLASLHQLVDLL